MVCRQAEGSRHIACASGSSSCGETLDLPHPREPDRSEQDWFAFNRHKLRRRSRQEATDRTHATGPIPFGAFCQTLLSQHTRLTIALVGQIHGSLGKGILLAHFTQPQAGSCRTAQFSILLQHARPRPRNALWLVQTLRPIATGHTLAVRVLKLRRQQELLWQGPTRVSRTWTPCIACPRQRRRFHTH